MWRKLRYSPERTQEKVADFHTECPFISEGKRCELKGGDILLQPGKHMRGIPFPLFRSGIPCPNYAPARLLPPLSPIFLFFFFSPFFPKWFFLRQCEKKGAKSCECSMGGKGGEKMGLRRLFGFLPLSSALCTFCGREKTFSGEEFLEKVPSLITSEE